MTFYPEGGWLPLPRGMKPHLRPSYLCPPGTVYTTPSRVQTRTRMLDVVYPADGRNLGFERARELWQPPRQNRGRVRYS